MWSGFWPSGEKRESVCAVMTIWLELKTMVAVILPIYIQQEQRSKSSEREAGGSRA